MTCPRCASSLGLELALPAPAPSPGRAPASSEGLHGGIVGMPRRGGLAGLVNSATAAVIVCAAIALFVTTSALLTPRLTGRDLASQPWTPDEVAVSGCGVAVDGLTERRAACRPEAVRRAEPSVAPSATQTALAQLFPALVQPPRPGGGPPLMPGSVSGRAPAAGKPHDGTIKAPRPPSRPGSTPPPDAAPPPPPRPIDAGPPAPARRIRVRDMQGRPVVARVHGGEGRNTHVLLPDGQLGIPDTLIETDEPFVPATADEIEANLLAGPFAGFKTHHTEHYVILYRSSQAFAAESGEVLENLYKGLMEAFRKFDLPVREAEFPLVAIIFATEAEFRAYRKVDAAVQAYYEIYTNRIHFYETSERDDQAPEVAALRRPQTVAHEGTHQILQNIGVQPRRAEWPPWLIEGLAEYCAAPANTKRGPTWSGLGIVNAQHVATIRDLDDPLSGQVPGATRPEHIGRRPGMPLVEYLVTKTELSPTDYALAWGMTHYLAMKRVDDFVAYLRTMSQMPPLQPRTPADHLAAFRDAFGTNLMKLDKDIGKYLARVKVNDRLPYYAVMFEQRVPNNLVRRAAIVSQSPSMILQWLQTVTSPHGDAPTWKAVPHDRRTRAYVTAEQFIRGL